VARKDVEDEIHRLCSGRSYHLAATLILEEYGSEILSLLCSRLRSDGNGREVFGMFCEDLWRALPRFEFRCSSRTWAYVLARHAELRFRAAPERRPERNLPFSEQLDKIAERARTSTSPYRQTFVQERMRQLRQRLAEQDELILLLRVDRGLSWREIACVFLPSELAGSDAVLRREAARLRQRFQAIKQSLRHWAEEEGLLQEKSSGPRELEPPEPPPRRVPAPALD
jgi:RNA polymerase sigma-70 factor, ECF subfamily